MALTKISDTGVKTSNTPSDGKYLQYKDGTDKLTWADVPAGVGGANGVDFNDNVKARYGAGYDLNMWSDGSVGIIQAPSGGGIHIGDADTENIIDVEPSQVVFNKNLISQDNDIDIRKSGASKLLWDDSDTAFEFANDVKLTFGGSAGSSGQVLTSGGASAAPSWAAVPAGGNSFEAVADGAIVATKPVCLNLTNGKVYNPVKTTSALSAPSIGTETNFGTSDSTDWKLISIGGNKFFYAWKNGTSGDDGFGTVVTYDPNAETVTKGQHVNYSGTDYSSVYNTPVYDSNVDKIIVFFCNGQSANAIDYNVGTVSGTGSSATTTWAGKTELEAEINSSNKWQGLNGCFDPDSNRVTLIFQNHGTHGTYSRTGQIASNGTVTWGNRQDIMTGSLADEFGCDICYDTNIDRYIATFAYQDSGAYKCLGWKVGQLSGNNISWGTLLETKHDPAGNYRDHGPNIVFDSQNNTVLTICQYTGDSKLYGYPLKATGGSTNTIAITDTAPHVIGDGEHSTYTCTFDTGVNKVVVCYNDNTDSSRPHTRFGTFSENYSGSNDKYTWSTEVQVSTNGQDGGSTWWGANPDGPDHYEVRMASLPAGGRTFFLYKSGGQRMAQIKSTNTTSTLTNAQHYVGFPDANYSDGATATIKTQGNVVTGLSGLSIGEVYYDDGNGGLVLYADRWQDAETQLGRALATDKLQVNTNYM